MADRIFNLQGESDPILTQIAQGYSNSAFIGTNLFPIIKVEKESGKTPCFGRENLKIYDSFRAIRAQAKQIMPEDITFTNYKLEEHAIEFPIDWREAEAAKELVRLENYAARALMESLSLEMENEIAGIATNTDNYEISHKDSLSGTNEKWDNANSNPIEQLRDAIETIRHDNIRKPNTLVLGASSFAALQDHPKLLERISHTQHSVVTEDLIACLLGTKNEPMKVVVGAGVYYDSINKSNVDLWSDVAILAYVPTANEYQRTRYEPSFGYTFSMNGLPLVRTSIDRNGLIKYVLAEMMYSAKMLNSNAGFLFTDTLS